MPDYEQGQGIYSTNMDLVYCIDATSSMIPHIERTKAAAKTLQPDLLKALENKSRKVEQLRLKVIIFRDFSYDGEDAIKQSRFFNLPDETEEYEKFVNEIKAEGGGPDPESSLEALHLAMKSEWNISGQDKKRRHVIVLFTDAPAQRLDDSTYRDKAINNPLYPQDTPTNLIGIQNEWNEIMDKRAKRLIIFAPNASPWDEIAEDFDNCMVTYAKAADGLDEVTNSAVLDVIAKTI